VFHVVHITAIRPRSRSLRSGSHYSANPPINCHIPAGEGTADSDEDVTGDSGMGTGSGSAQYEDVKAWRQAMHNPPPGGLYTLHCAGGRDAE